jgi:hypothetical protein
MRGGASARLRQDSVDIPMQDLRKLLAGSRGEVIVARRLTRAEQAQLEREREDSDAGVHARIVVKEEERFRRLGRGGTSKR